MTQFPGSGGEDLIFGSDTIGVEPEEMEERDRLPDDVLARISGGVVEELNEVPRLPIAM